MTCCRPCILPAKNACSRGENGKIVLSSGMRIGSMPLRMKMRKFATITVLVLSSFAANNVAPSKAELETMYDKAFREFDAQ